MSLLALALVLVTGVAAQAQSTYVPSVVVSSVSAIPVPAPDPKHVGTAAGDQTAVVNPVEVMLDACNNVYTLDFGPNGTTGTTVTEIPANGGAATIVENVGQYYPTHIGQDPTRTNLIAGQAYGTGANLIPLINCVPQSSNAHHIGGGSGALFYYYNPGYFAGDFAGNTYISTQSTCCVTGSYYLVQEQGGNGTILLTNQAKEIDSMAIDKNENVYFISGGALFELPSSGGSGIYPTAAVPFGGTYSAPVGLSVDLAGNLYIADEGSSTIYEIPYETNGSTGALNLADQFVVATGVNSASAVAVDARGDIFFTPQNATAVEKLSLGNADFGAVAVGQTATRKLTFQFNAAATPASVILPTGVFGTTSGGAGSVPCTAGAPYSPTGISACTVTVTFTPTSVGKQSSSVTLADASGNSIATAYIEGIGQGATLTLDPGTVSPAGSGLKAPTGIAIDGKGNAFIADPAANAIVELPAGGGAPVTLTVSVASPSTTSTANAALPLAAPTGVAVAGDGSLVIADTGNNRVIKIPYVNGALSTTGEFVAGGFNSPASVFVQTNGDLYVTDTGNNQVLLYPSFATGYGTPSTVATGLTAPLATTADAAGNVFIANSGEGTILELPLGGSLETVDAGIQNPSGLATDTSGALFVVDQGNFRVLRIPSANGQLSTNSAAEVGLGVANPYGVALDAAANLYITDSVDSAAYMVNRSQVALSFGDLSMGTTSDALPLTVESAGNLPLIFNTPYFTGTGNTGDFAMTSPTGACGDGVTLLPGSSCDLTTTFTPAAGGARTATLAFSSNPPAPAQVTLSGTGITLATTTTKLGFTFAAGPNAPFYGEPLSFAATVTGSSPTGSVSFIVDGVQVALLPLVSGVATLPLNSGLTGGNHSVYAVYKGDSANDGSSTAVLAITIARAPTTATIVVNKITFTNPYSIRHSNTGSCTVTDTTGNANSFPAIPNDGVAFIASVSSPGVGIPSGTLTFFSDGRPITTDPSTNLPSSTSQLLPAAGGLFSGGYSSDANTLGDGDIVGENNVLVGPHAITVSYAGDQNYLPSTSVPVIVTVVDVGPTTPVILPESPVQPAPYCDPTSSIAGSRPAVPATFEVQPSANTITASAAVPGTVKLTLSSLGDYDGVVAVSCPDLPQYTTCSLNPGQILVSPSTPGTPALPGTGTLTVTTNVPPYIPTANQGLWWLPAGALGMLLLFTRRRFAKMKNVLTLFGIAMVLIGGMAGLAGCGSGSSSAASAITKPGSYTITVVLQGSQLDPEEQYAHENFRPDLPYPVKFTLVVK